MLASLNAARAINACEGHFHTFARVPLLVIDRNLEERFRVGMDVGGTFTDAVAFDATGGSLRCAKAPSTVPHRLH